MLSDRFVGSLLGLAAGDALGGPMEGLTAEQIQESFGRVESFVDSSLERPGKWRQPGLHSDDTQQALILTEAILESGRANPDLIVQKMVALSEGPSTVVFGGHRGSGRNFRFSVMEMRSNGRWASGSRNTAGIGASMRVAPVGLFFAGDDPALRENATLSALVTHNDPRGCLAACAVAYLAGRASRAAVGSLDPAGLFADLQSFVRRSEGWIEDVHGSRAHPRVRGLEGQFGDALESLNGRWCASPERVLPDIEARATALAGYEIGHPCRGFALAGVVAAIYFFLRHRENVREALIETVNAGGDTDSVGAIVGALCGAAGGEEAIPNGWLEGLIARDQIRLRALALAGEETDGDDWRELETAELEWTLEEDRLRREAFPEGTFPDEYEWEEPPAREPSSRSEESAGRRRPPRDDRSGDRRRPRRPRRR